MLPPQNRPRGCRDRGGHWRRLDGRTPPDPDNPPLKIRVHRVKASVRHTNHLPRTRVRHRRRGRGDGIDAEQLTGEVVARSGAT
jgi:hypothetical protein